MITESAEAPVDPGIFGDVLRRCANEVSLASRCEHPRILEIRKFRSGPISSNRMANLTPEAFAKWRGKRLSEVQPATVSRETQLMSVVLNSARKEKRMKYAARDGCRVRAWKSEVRFVGIKAEPAGGGVEMAAHVGDLSRSYPLWEEARIAARLAGFAAQPVAQEPGMWGATGPTGDCWGV